MKQLGLIHSGIIPIEEAIKIYREKYSKTLKIKNIVDTFQKKLETQRYFTNLKKDIAKNKEQEEKFNNIIYNIKNKIDIAKEILQYKKKFERIDDIEQINGELDNFILKIISNIKNFIDDNRGNILDSKEVENIYHLFMEIMEIIENYQLEIKKLVNVLLNQYEEILDGYIENVKSLGEDRFLNIKIDIKSDRNNFQYIEINKKYIKETLSKNLSIENIVLSLLCIQYEIMIYKKNVMDFLENQVKAKMEMFLENEEYKLNDFIMKKKEEYNLYLKKYKEIELHRLKDNLNWLNYINWFNYINEKISDIIEI